MFNFTIFSRATSSGVFESKTQSSAKIINDLTIIPPFAFGKVAQGMEMKMLFKLPSPSTGNSAISESTLLMLRRFVHDERTRDSISY